MLKKYATPLPSSTPEHGNVLFIILIAVGLFATLSYVVSGSNRGGTGIERDQLRIKASDTLSYANRIKAAVNSMYTQNGVSESDINFSHPDAPAEYGDPFDTGANPVNTQVFSHEGGGVTYMLPPAIIKQNPADGFGWEFLGTSRGPDVGYDDTADLMAVLPHVKEGFCHAVNDLLGYDSGVIPDDSQTDSACVFPEASIGSNRFTGSFTVPGSANDMGSSNYVGQNFRLPAHAACVMCGTGEYHFYMTILER